jgi:DNA-binding HxlR family transcriptional regulator
VLQRDYPGQICSIARALEVVGERWTLLILRDAVDGLERFEEFEESLGIASNVLTSRLKMLCDEGVLERMADPERPGRPKYVLTEKGWEVGPVLFDLMKWGDRFYPALNGPPRLTVHGGCGGDVGADRLCDRCGEHVAFAELDLPLGPGSPGGRRAAVSPSGRPLR